MITTTELLWALAAATGFVLTFVVAHVVRRYGASVEVCRKFIHIASGSITLTFPWLFGSHWIVLYLTLVSIVGLVLMRFLRPLPTLHGVDRDSWGEVLLPVGIYLTFLIAELQGVMASFPYAVAMLVFGDSCAAIVGKALGRRRYRVGSEYKSVSGSVTMYAVCAGIVALWGWANGVPAHTTLYAVLAVAPCLTVAESIAVKGVDNLIIPVSALLLLYGAQVMPADSPLWIPSILSAVMLAAMAWLGTKRADVRPASLAIACAAFLAMPAFAVVPYVGMMVLGVLSTFTMYMTPYRTSHES